MQEAILQSNAIVQALITNDPLTQFQAVSPNTIQFSGTDPEDGTTYIGSYTMSNLGVVTNYDFIGFPDPSNTNISLYLGATLSGNPEDFLYHAFTLHHHVENEPHFINALAYALDTGYGQDLANWVDIFPGSKPNDPVSTVVGIGPGNQYYA